MHKQSSLKVQDEQQSFIKRLSSLSVWFLVFTIIMTIIFAIVTATIPLTYDENNDAIRNNEWAFWCFLVFLALSIINCGMCFHFDGGSVTETTFNKVMDVDYRLSALERKLNISVQHRDYKCFYYYYNIILVFSFHFPKYQIS
jgi:hypothetical protein